MARSLLPGKYLPRGFEAGVPAAPRRRRDRERGLTLFSIAHLEDISRLAGGARESQSMQLSRTLEEERRHLIVTRPNARL